LVGDAMVTIHPRSIATSKPLRGEEVCSEPKPISNASE
jgi:hypothetical protein